MIRLIFTQNVLIRDSLTRVLGLVKKEDGINGIVLYQKNDWLLVYSPDQTLSVLFGNLLELYQPDRMYLPILGRSIDLIHERGDVILPNVFLRYNSALETTEITKENQDSFLQSPEFLELYEEQKDYFVEDFGLSVGGIVVEKVPENTEFDTKLLQAYEADVYVGDELSGLIALMKLDEVPMILSVGVAEGKKSAYESGDIVDITMKNMVTTWRLFEEENE